LERQKKIIARTSERLKQTTIIQRDLSNIRQSSRGEHRKTREQIDTLSAKIDSIQIAAPSATVARRSKGRDIFFVGECQESVLTPLLLLRNVLRGAVLDLVSQHTETVLEERLYWLQAEYENLVSSATQEVAALSQGSTATSFDNWCDNRWAAQSSKIGSPAEHLWPERHLKAGRVERHTISADQKPSRQQVARTSFTYSFDIDAGRLHLTLSRSNPHEQNTDDPDEVGFFFRPSPTVCTTAVSARFVKVLDRFLEPRFYTQLNAFSIAPKGFPSRYEDLFVQGTVKDIDLAIRNGTISPYHIEEATKMHLPIVVSSIALPFADVIDSCIFSILSLILHLQYAVCGGRVDLLRYFDSQGIGISNLK